MYLLPLLTSVAIFRFALSRIFLLSTESESIKTSCSSRAHARNVTASALKALAAPREARGVGKYFSITPRKRGIPTRSKPALVNPRADSSAPRWNRRSSLAGLMARKKFYRRRPVGAAPAGRWRAYLAVNLAPRSSGLIKQAFLAGFRVSRRIAGLAGTAETRIRERTKRKRGKCPRGILGGNPMLLRCQGRPRCCGIPLRMDDRWERD